MRGTLGALALAGALLMAGSAHAAPAMRVYRSAALHYTVTYPATWTRIGVSGADFAAVSSDRRDFVSVSVAPGKANALAVQHALAQVFAAFGRPLGGPSYRPFRIHGATGTLARDPVATPDGKMSLVLAFMLSRHRRLYTALGVVRDVTPRTSADVTAALTFIANTAVI